MNDRKRFGKYYTPIDLAKRMVKRVYKPGMRVLEPSCGSGVFIDAIIETDPNADITAVDIDENAVDSVRGKGIRVIHGDFLKIHFPAKFDLIIGNPPWVNLREIEGKYKEIASRLGFEIKAQNVPNINLSALFVMKSASLLNKGGTICFVMPRTAKTSNIYEPMRKSLSCSFVDVDTDFPVPATIMTAKRILKRPEIDLKKARKPYYYMLGREGADVLSEEINYGNPYKIAVRVISPDEIEYIEKRLPIRVSRGRYEIIPGTDRLIARRLDYFGKLSNPAQRSKYRVVYNANGNMVIASIIDDKEVIVSDRLIYIPVRTMAEAVYLRNILNSDELNEFVDSIRSSSRGHISKRALLYPIRRYSQCLKDLESVVL